MMLHVGLNLVYWEPDSGGCGTYARQLIKAIHRVEPDTRITAWLGAGAPRGLEDDDWGGQTRFIRLPLKSTGSPVLVAWGLGVGGFAGCREQVDVVHGLAYVSPLVAPRVARVVTIHDLTWHHHRRAVTKRARAMFTLATALCGRTADRVIVDSQHVRDDLVATIGIDCERIDVVPLGVAQQLATSTPASRLRARLGLPAGSRVLLSVGQLSAHKNLAVLIDALAAIPERDACLVLAGRRTPHVRELELRAAEQGVADRVVLPGLVDDHDLEGLYDLATGLVVPSLSEGFGLPVLEAMRRGLPVACSDAGALPEVAGDAALLFDPHDRAAVARALRRVLGEPELRERLGRRGRARAAQYPWERTAKATLATYRRAIAGR